MMQRQIWLGLSLGAAFLILGAWMNSGTLAPYAATLPEPKLDECGYLLNIDHPHFTATYHMLAGDDRSLWHFSVVLRRILFPLFAFPWMALFGILTGGLIAGILVHLIALGVASRVLVPTLGMKVTLWWIALFVSFPGIYYWIGLPYSYSAIVPGSVLLWLCAFLLDRERERSGALLLCLGAGVLFTAYDFLPIFLPTFLWLLWRGRQTHRLGMLGVLALLGPYLTVSAVLKVVTRINFWNSNTSIYRFILRSFAGESEWEIGAKLWALPSHLIANLFGSVHVGLAALAVLLAFLVLAYTGKERTRLKPFLPGQVESAILLTAFCIFAANNLAPSYEGWQMRGDWIARIYQPICAPLLFWTAYVLGNVPAFGRASFRRAAWLGGIATIGFNLSVVLGPILGWPHADTVHHLFYRHAEAGWLNRNLETHGRRPLGFCQTDGRP